ncbi:Acyltransferase family protein [uncultured Leptotrichia sp.]|uniref:acyltransferase family protein n=1 Tax=uncultured Leptotrichia sp. TaxID=159271 RepID=UPI001A5F5FE4|nr:acyltransferase [uncultured Leptotrichia sp.]VTX49117.1 Acyltransferase family protein [uncultured Leptotrichia sp.]
MIMKNFRVIESFRFFAALLVAFGHLFYMLFKIPSSARLSVEFFFVLSAFLITLKIKENDEFSSSIYLKKLFIGRTIRLLFPYMILYLIYTMLYYTILHGNNLKLYDFFVDFFLFQTLGLRRNIYQGLISGISWSLGMELYIGTIYFTFIHYCKQRYKEALCFICIMLLPLYPNIKIHLSNYINSYFDLLFDVIPMTIPRTIFSFSIGTLACLFYQNYKIKLKKNETLIFTILEFFIILLIIIIYGHFNFNSDNDFIFPFFAAVLIIIFSYEKGIISIILKKFSILGTLSYSIYMIHPIILDIMLYYKITSKIFFLILLLVFSILFYNLVEKRIIKMKYIILDKFFPKVKKIDKL